MPVTLPDLPTDPAFYGAVALGMVALVLIGRVPFLRRLFQVAISVVLVGLLVLIVQQRGAFDPSLARIAGALDLDRQRVEGSELRVPMANDGHFWVRANIDGVERRLLVDSGATVTALSSDVAAAAGIATERGVIPVVLRTANGVIQPETGQIDELRLGNIVARDLKVVVSPAFGDTSVLGMNFLSRLKSWRVEGRTLILVPNHPQPVAAG